MSIIAGINYKFKAFNREPQDDVRVFNNIVYSPQTYINSEDVLIWERDGLIKMIKGDIKVPPYRIFELDVF